MVRAPIAGLAPGDKRLDGAIAHYLGRVLRLRADDAFIAFDPASGREAPARVLETGRDAITVRFGDLREGTARPPRAVTWIQGLAKGDKCDAIVRDATELGAARIAIATPSRSVVKLEPARASDRRARWDRIAREAARQCGRSDAPAVDGPCPWADALAMAPAEAVRFCLWEEATVLLGPALFEALAGGAPLAFACGPEGGLTRAEVEEASARGWSIASLGGLVLRTETVAAAVLGAVCIFHGWGAPRGERPSRR